VSLSVLDCDLAGEPASELLERGWFGLLSAIEALQASPGERNKRSLGFD
jgi:hypothetical protein